MIIKDIIEGEGSPESKVLYIAMCIWAETGAISCGNKAKMTMPEIENGLTELKWKKKVVQCKDGHYKGADDDVRAISDLFSGGTKRSKRPVATNKEHSSEDEDKN